MSEHLNQDSGQYDFGRNMSNVTGLNNKVLVQIEKFHKVFMKYQNEFSVGYSYYTFILFLQYKLWNRYSNWWKTWHFCVGMKNFSRVHLVVLQIVKYTIYN